MKTKRDIANQISTLAKCTRKCFKLHIDYFAEATQINREKLKKIVNPIKKNFGRLYASGITDKEELTKLLGNRDVEIVIEKYE